MTSSIKSKELTLPLVPVPSLSVSNFNDIYKSRLEKVKINQGSIRMLFRGVVEQYRSLPWPKELKRVTFFTDFCDGKGDIAAAAKVIDLMHKIEPSLEFDWSLWNSDDVKEAKGFLTCIDLSKVTVHKCTDVRYNGKKVPDSNFLVVGPAKSNNDAYILNRLGTKVDGPRFRFLECAERSSDLLPLFGKKAQNISSSLDNVYREAHKVTFVSESTEHGGVPMGLSPGSGVLLDKSRLQAPLSLGYCCPKYLLKIQDQGLKNDILSALGVSGSVRKPSYSSHSFNFGYAHNQTSWKKFIDFTAIHEPKKNVTIVLNQKARSGTSDIKIHSKRIFTSERLSLLKELGYGTIKVKGEEEKPIVVQESSSPGLRSLTLIMRPFFQPEDMKNLQLAAERLLATGDNTAAESWASKCKLYLYEDIGNSTTGCKRRFLAQQVKLASSIYPPLGELLRIAGTLWSVPKKKMETVRKILADPKLSKKTVEFCHKVIKDYSFSEILEGGLKRAAWHYVLPSLIQAEADAMDGAFKKAYISFLKDGLKQPQQISFKNLPLIGKKVQEIVEKHLKNSSLSKKDLGDKYVSGEALLRYSPQENSEITEKV